MSPIIRHAPIFWDEEIVHAVTKSYRVHVPTAPPKKFMKGGKKLWLKKELKKVVKKVVKAVVSK